MARLVTPLRIAVSAMAIISASGAAANTVQANGGNAVDERASERASDAFGVRIGVEQIGLYTESQVRGLSLQTSGNYRLAGAYFVRAGNLVDPVLAGVTTRVGYNALGADFASPSGLVEYSLKSPIDAPGSSGAVALTPYGGRFYEAALSREIVDGKLGLLVGAQLDQVRWSSGHPGQSERVGAIAEWRPAPGARILAFGTLNDFDFEGSYGVAARGDALPPRARHPNVFLPAWGDHDGQDINGGIIASVQPTPTLTVTGSAIYSRLDLREADYVLYNVDEEGKGDLVITSNRPRENDALAGALGASWQQGRNGRLFGEVRMRQTKAAFGPSETMRIANIDLNGGFPESTQPSLPPAPRTTDRTEQVTAGIGYEHSFARLRLKGGVQVANHSRRFARPDAAETASQETSWLYDLSGAYALSPQWTAFATLVRGLEDSGIAPGNAANANDVLPVVVAEQQELGVRGTIGSGFTLIASAFSIEKPALSFDADGVYGLSGDRRHRGFEVSLSGRITPNLRMLAGAAYLHARRSSDLVNAGIQSAKIPGISDLTALASLNWTVPGLDGLSIDGQVNYSTERRVRSNDDLTTPVRTVVDVGALQTFTLGGAAMSLRFRIMNLFDNDKWVAQTSELLDRPARRGVRLTLGVRG